MWPYASMVQAGIQWVSGRNVESLDIGVLVAAPNSAARKGTWIIEIHMLAADRGSKTDTSSQ